MMRRWRIVWTLRGGRPIAQEWLEEYGAALATERARLDAVMRLQADRDAAELAKKERAA